MNLTVDQADIAPIVFLQHEERNVSMLRKLMFSLAAAAALGAAALAPGAASAAPWGHWHGYGHGWYRFGPYAGPVYSSCVMRRWVPTPWGPRLRWVNICY
jgi:hypothetical protein